MKNFLTLILCTLMAYGCAQFVPPTGGPKDTKPPTLLNSIPENQTRNFHGQTIILTFDELIDANSLRQEVIITPEPDNVFDMKVKNESIIITFDKPFKDSTTYTFNFRNGVKDLSEKNPAENLKLVFSTGSEIDSLKLSGSITELKTRNKVDKALVGLYEVKTDSIPYLKRKPSYFIRTDTTGTYSFENIKNTPYRLIAFTDQNQNLVFDSKTESIAFLTDTIKLDTITTEINLSVYPNNNTPAKLSRTLSKQQTVTLNFDKNIKDANVQYISNDTLNYKIDKSKLIFFNYPTALDTILTKIVVLDSNDNKLEIEPKIKFSTIGNDKPYIPKTFSISVQNIKSNSSIKFPDEYLIEFEEPIIQLKTDSITLSVDSVTYIPLTYLWQDSAHTKLKIVPRSKPNVDKLTLSIPEGTITNYQLDSNRNFTLINNVYPQAEYGKIGGSFEDFEGQKIVELIDYKTKEVIDSQIFIDKFQFKELLPGNYIFRITQDINENGKWDPGDFDLNTLPEKVFVSKGLIKLKANFELQDIKLK